MLHPQFWGDIPFYGILLFMHENETELFHGNIYKEQHDCLALKIMPRFHFWGVGNELSFWHIYILYVKYTYFSTWIYEDTQELARFLDSKEKSMLEWKI